MRKFLDPLPAVIKQKTISRYCPFNAREELLMLLLRQSLLTEAFHHLLVDD
jgi:hypothetical protein